MPDESEFTPGAAPGWESWDEWSPEIEFAAFAGTLQRMLQPAVVLETGVGVGRITQYLDLDASEWLGFESDPEWRTADLPYQADLTFDLAQINHADLVILDSAKPLRPKEIKKWAAAGKPGSVCLVHDAGERQAWERPDSIHARVRQAIYVTRINGVYTGNPRSGWLAVHP
jgi:hypothetical protein